MEQAFPTLFISDSIRKPLEAEAFQTHSVENKDSLIARIRRDGCEVNMRPCNQARSDLPKAQFG